MARTYRRLRGKLHHRFWDVNWRVFTDVYAKTWRAPWNKPMKYMTKRLDRHQRRMLASKLKYNPDANYTLIPYTKLSTMWDWD